MDPAQRQLIQVTIEDAEIADEVFSIFMGDNAQLRREALLEDIS